jgi:hypothetical protein
VFYYISQFITFLSDTNAARIYIFIFSIAILYPEILNAFVALGASFGFRPPTPFGGPDYKLLLSTDLCCTDRVNILQGIKFQKPSGF